LRVTSTSSQKPYRVYRQPRRVRGDGAIPWGDVPGGAPGGRGPRNAGAPRRVLRFVRRALFVALALGLVWIVIAFLSFRQAVNARNDALPKDVRAALAPAGGPAIASSHVTMLVGADTSSYRRGLGEKNGRADTLMLMRVDIPSRTVSLLSIPRDLYVEVPGYGREKINSAYSEGGLPLAIKTVRNATGVDVNHVAQVDFDGFKEVVDELGGIEIDNPFPVESGNTPFDGRHWRFRKGKQTLNGRDALAYARLRYVSDATFAANEQEGTELGRARRQQRVIDAIIGKVISLDSLKHPNGVPKAVVKPLLTDISAGQMIVFGFGKWWSKADNSLRCRLGGDDGYDDLGGRVVIPDETNRAVVRMFLGKQAPVAPENALSAGCVRQAD
jgi:LCP family protein required for cell wall assembly